MSAHFLSNRRGEVHLTLSFATKYPGLSLKLHLKSPSAGCPMHQVMNVAI